MQSQVNARRGGRGGGGGGWGGFREGNDRYMHGLIHPNLFYSLVHLVSRHVW